MDTQSQNPLTILRWTMLTCAGWLIGIILVVGLAALAEAAGLGENTGGQVVVGLGMGAGVGLMQWIALRKHRHVSQQWIWFSIFGFSLSYIAFEIIGRYADLKPEIVLPFATALGALMTGWLQYYFVLRKMSLNARSWIAHNTIAWIIAHMASMSMILLKTPQIEELPRVLIVVIALAALLMGAVVLGIITGRSIVSIAKKE